ncbi:phospholipase D-like domain-containing protein [Vibrio cyclitrophicus]
MGNLKGIIYLLLLIHAMTPIANAEPSLIYHHFPACSEKKFEAPISTVNGAVSYGIKGNVYCDIADKVEQQKSKGKSEFYAILQGSDLKRVRFYAFAPSNIIVKTALCNLSKNGVAIDFVDSGQGNSTHSDTVMALRRCGGNNINASSFYSGGGIPSFHPKIYIVERNDGKANLITSSGHPIRGFSYNFEHWVYYDLSVGSSFFENHMCYLDTIDFMLKKEVGAREGSEFFNQCRVHAGNDQHVTPYFLPFDIEKYRSEIESDIFEAKEINISMFSVGSEWIRNRLLQALKLGVDVKIVVDDDHFYFYSNGCKNNLQPNCQYYSSRHQYDRWIAFLAEWGAEVRFLQTNNKGRGQMLHDKYMIIKGGNPRVYFGSANFTNAAFGKVDRLSGNLENVYSSHLQKIIESFSVVFGRTWGLGTPLEKLPKDAKSIVFN